MKIEDHLISRRFKFLVVAKLFEYISDPKTAPTAKTKQRILKIKLEGIREKFEGYYGTLDSAAADGDSIYALVSLMMPEYDRSRYTGSDVNKIRLKESTLGPLIGRALGLDENGPDFQKLKQVKDRGSHGEGLSSIVELVMATRARTIDTGPWVGDVHVFLDGLVRSAKDQQQRLLRDMLKNMTPLEGKWLTRIILRKKMGLGLSNSQILEVIHPGICPKEVGNNDLKKLCQEVNDPKKQPNGNQIDLFSPFNVMLLSRLNQLEIDEGESRAVGGDNNSYRNQLRLPKPPFIVETKYDGERFTLHYKQGSEDVLQCFKLFSKKGNDYTGNFVKRLLPLLHEKIKPNCKSFILDGELMVWDSETRDFERKNLNVSFDVKTLDSKEIQHVPVFVAFDIVYYNGKQLAETKIEDRIRIMRNEVCDVTKGVIEFSEQQIIYSKEQIEKELEKAILNFQEGLVVKQCGSKYRGFRDTAWMKVKPANLDGHGVNDLDVVILGVYYEKKRISSFLVGLFDESDMKYYPICSVGGGRLTREDTKHLGEKLQPHLVESAPSNVSSKYKSRPSLWIDPVKSVILQINAYNIKPTEKNDLKYTLQAPVPHQIRDDQSLENILTRREFDSLRRTHGGALVSTHTSKLHTTFRANITAQKRTVRRTLLPRTDVDDYEDFFFQFDTVQVNLFKPLSETSSRLRSVKFHCNKKPLNSSGATSSTSCSTGIFKDLIFYLVGTQEWIAKISAIVKENGGTRELKTLSKAHHTVAEKHTKRAEDCGKTVDVLKEVWITHCVTSQKLVFEPDHYWITTSRTEETFRVFYDKYKNAYTKPVSSSAEMEAMLEKIDIEMESQPKKISLKRKYADQLDEAGIPEKRRRKLSMHQVFDDCCIVLVGVEDKFVLEMKIRLNGGTIATSPEHESVSHIVIDTVPESFSWNEKAHLVCLDWLKDCLSQKNKLDESKYNPRCASSSG